MEATSKRRVTTRSPVASARIALRVTRHVVPAYSSTCSKRTFTQHQLVEILALAPFFKNDHRGAVALLKFPSDPRDGLGLKRSQTTRPCPRTRTAGNKGGLDRLLCS